MLLRFRVIYCLGINLTTYDARLLLLKLLIMWNPGSEEGRKQIGKQSSKL